MPDQSCLFLPGCRGGSLSEKLRIGRVLGDMQAFVYRQLCAVQDSGPASRPALFRRRLPLGTRFIEATGSEPAEEPSVKTIGGGRPR